MLVQIPNLSQIDTLPELLNLLIGLTQRGFYLTFLLFLMYGAYMYMVSRGDEEKVVKARNILVYAIIGFVIGVLANPFSQILLGILNQG